MKYVLLVFQGSTPLPGTAAWDALSPEEQKSVYVDYDAVNKTEGVTAGLPLGPVDKAQTVTVVDGRVEVADRPYAGPNLAAGGYSVVEADSVEDVIGIAARIPAARLGGGVEIRVAEAYW